MPSTLTRSKPQSISRKVPAGGVTAGRGSRLRAIIQWGGLLAGPLLALAAFALLPGEYHDVHDKLVQFDVAGRLTLSVMVWMAVWWLTEAIHISATALLPLVLLPLFGAATTTGAAQPYAHPLVFLVMGGFLIALAMQKWSLDKRIALITLKAAGTNPKHMVAGFMLITAGLSAFVSNTATAAMMLPIALSMIALIKRSSENDIDRHEESHSEEVGKNFALCTLLGLAYAASIGGIITIIGTGPNAFLVAFINETISQAHRMEITFLQWLTLALPLAAVFLPVTWYLLTHVLYPIKSKEIKGGAELIESGLAELGRANRGEKLTLAVFVLTAFMWIFRPLLVKLTLPVGGVQVHVFGGLTDTVIAMMGAMLLFVIPVDLKRREFVMDWDTALKIPFGIMLLLGGGLSLSHAVQINGVADFIGSQAQYFSGVPTIVLVCAVTVVVIFLTELTSNIATTAALLPILAALAPGLGVHPYLLIFPATIAASCAFMMPVATPPNAIVFGSRQVSIPQMMRAGIWLNIIGIVLVTALSMTVVPQVLGI